MTLSFFNQAFSLSSPSVSVELASYRDAEGFSERSEHRAGVGAPPGARKTGERSRPSHSVVVVLLA